MQVRGWLALALVMTTGLAHAEGLSSSPKPLARPILAATGPAAADLQMTVATANGPAMRSSLFPSPRPVRTAAAPVITPESVVELAAYAGPSVLRPKARPKGLADTFAAEPGKPARKGWSLFKVAATRTPPGKALIQPRNGSVCGDPSIRGEAMAPVIGKIKSCGIADPVMVTSVAGVSLSQAAEIDCPTAIALKNWVENGLQPGFGKNQVVQLQIAGSYACRPRNNVRGNKISEHGRGKAVDVSGFVLADGSKLSIHEDYRKVQAIKVAHKAACGVFGTTLGPGSDGYHEDHLHFDTAKYRSGAYCR